MREVTSVLLKVFVIVTIAMGLMLTLGSSVSAEEWNAECYIKITNILGEIDVEDEGECVVARDTASNACTMTLNGTQYSLYPPACVAVANGENYQLVTDSFVVEIVVAEDPPISEPQDKDGCKDGAWEAYGFTNQGQCIKFVNNG